MAWMVEYFPFVPTADIYFKLSWGLPSFLQRFLQTEISKNLGLESRVTILGRVGYSDVAKQLSSSSIGILINSSMNKHSTSYTSPLKYFEYLAARLKVIAVDFPSHRELPFSDKITFFHLYHFYNLLDLQETYI